MRHVVIAVFQGVQALDVSGPLDVFSEANAFVAEGAGYAASIASPGGAEVRASNGQRLLAGPVARGRRRVRRRARRRWPGAAAATGWTRRSCAGCATWRRAARASGRSAAARSRSVPRGCSTAGPVTTHWQWSALLARRFPDARVEADRIHSRDGALITSAGVTAGIDLALALVAEDHGAAVARAVAKRLVVFAQRQGGQSQFSPYLAAASGDDADPMDRVQSYVIAHLRGDLSVAALAAVAGMSERSVRAPSSRPWAEATPHWSSSSARASTPRAACSRARPRR